MRILVLTVLMGVSSIAISAGEPIDAEAGDTAAVGDASAGADKVAVCVACHGEGGKAPLAPTYPHIAGQSSEYLESALQAYRAGLRQGGMSAMMSPQAAMLSDQDIKDIAAYYSEQSMAGDAEASSQ